MAKREADKILKDNTKIKVVTKKNIIQEKGAQPSSHYVMRRWNHGSLETKETQALNEYMDDMKSQALP